MPCGIWIVVAGSLPPTKAPIRMLRIETNRLANSAVQKPETRKPRTSAATSRIISALITSRNRPKVTSVSGRVSTISSGFTTAFARPSSSAEMISAPVLSKLSPLKMRLATQSESAVMASSKIS